MKKLAALFAIAGAFYGTVACVAPTESAPTTQSQSQALRLDERTETVIRGSFTHGPSSISFESRIDAPGHVVMKLDVNGQVFDAWIDHAAQKAHWDGHNGALYDAELSALKAFLASLGEFYKGEHPTTLHEDTLVRRVSFWSEAPPGLTMPARDLDFVVKTGIKPLPANVPTTEEEATAIGPQTSQNGTDEDGIWYIACCAYRTATHDTTGHCKMYESILGGSCSTDCHGKCGPGCGFGTAGYTYDCHDHDRCGRVHGGSGDPWDSNCKDEYWEADDDFWNSIIGKCI